MSTPTATTAIALDASALRVVNPATPPMSMWSKMPTYANHTGDTTRTANECKFTGIAKRVATGRLPEVMT
jgi:hypothetical protein